MIEIKACKPFRSEDIVNYCITAIMFKADRKEDTLDELILMNLLKYLFVAVSQCMPLIAP